jgi:hypothetical protein
MSYFLLPKIHNTFFVFHCEEQIPQSVVNFSLILDKWSDPFITNSLLHYYNDLSQELTHLCQAKSISREEMVKIIHPYEFIFTKVPGSRFSVSKLQHKNTLFYDLLEVTKNINVFEYYKTETLNALIVGDNYQDSLDCFEMLREMYLHDTFFCFKELQHSLIENKTFNFIMIEIECSINFHSYIVKLLETIMILLKHLSDKGCASIKIENLFYKPTVDILYILSSIFDKTFLIKPSTSNITNFDKYIVVKHFQGSILKKDLYTQHVKNIKQLIESRKGCITNILKTEIPFYFSSKIDDFNVILGQQQLDAYEQIINMIKNKNRIEKIEVLKKIHIQKCVNWCEKFKIPCNKFSEKVNIFLPLAKDNIVIENGFLQEEEEKEEEEENTNFEISDF